MKTILKLLKRAITANIDLEIDRRDGETCIKVLFLRVTVIEHCIKD